MNKKSRSNLELNLCNLSPNQCNHSSNQCNHSNKKAQVSIYFISGIMPLIVTAGVISMVGNDIKALEQNEGAVHSSTLAACSAILTCSKDNASEYRVKPSADFVQEEVYHPPSQGTTGIALGGMQEIRRRSPASADVATLWLSHGTTRMRMELHKNLNIRGGGDGVYNPYALSSP
jgi:hypothetical protein